MPHLDVVHNVCHEHTSDRVSEKPFGKSIQHVGMLLRTRDYVNPRSRRGGALRADFDAARLKRCARRSGEADQVRRLLALAAIYDGASRAEAAEIGGVTRQIVRDWVVRLNEGGPEPLVTCKAPGQPSA